MEVIGDVPPWMLQGGSNEGYSRIKRQKTEGLEDEEVKVNVGG